MAELLVEELRWSVVEMLVVESRWSAVELRWQS